MIGLISRIENASGPDRELDGEIFKALNPDRDWHRFEDCWCARSLDDSAAFDTPPAYTSSIDAALTLVPEGMCWLLTSFPRGNGLAVAMVAGGGPEITAATPALALCAAALKARGIEG